MNGLGKTAAEMLDVNPAGSLVDVRELILQYPGPAMLYDATGRLISCNELAQNVSAGDELMDPASFADAVRNCARNTAPLTQRQRIGSGETALTFDVSYVPVLLTDAGPGVLVLPLDVSFESNLNDALIASRGLLKDLVACSSDFAWQTDRSGRFVFVSPRGALGLAAPALIGRWSGEFLAKEGGGDDSPFETAQAIDDVEHWLKTVDGEDVCMRISAVPVVAGDGAPDGVRGVCRDITEQIRQNEALERARRRETMTRSIIDAIRNSFKPDEMLDIALESVAPYIGASHAWIIYGADPAGEVRTFYDDGEAAPPSLKDAPLPRSSDESDQLITFFHEGRHFLSVACDYHLQIQGWLTLAWPVDELPSMDGIGLLRDVAAQVGIALAQAESRLLLERLSTVDELTGLLNRRACKEQIDSRISHHLRQKRAGSLLYIDLDNFKPVNDLHGHKIGDTVLRVLGEMLSGPGARTSNIAGRIGGDEFVVWLEETDLEGARGYGENLLREAGKLRQYSASDDAPLSLSIGVAGMNLHGADNVETLIVRADNAMYQAKNDGKGRVCVALPDAE